MSDRARGFYAKLNTIWDGLERAGDEPSLIAETFLDALAGRRIDGDLPEPFRGAVAKVHAEFDVASSSPSPRASAFERLEEALDRGFDAENGGAETLWAAFFPEALYLNADPDAQIPLLRQQRIVDIRESSPHPVENAAKEIVFTSNVLLSPPLGGSAVSEEGDHESDPAGTAAPGNQPFDGEDAGGAGAGSSSAILAGARKAASESQLYWYDHPIPVGTKIEADEAAYGLKGLSEALRYEKTRGTCSSEDRMTVLLSVSVTHAGLHRWARPWLKSQMDRLGNRELDGLDVFALTEDDAERVLGILEPWVAEEDRARLRNAFGVDGEYGRHYTFLKAMPALFSLLADKRKNATFKIDLDQVFPQEELAAETGKSAFEHFETPLWGARGIDADGRPVELGMIAGALVNERDIAAGVFTPDIPWPAEMPEGEDLLFFKQRPMAVSTRAELMTRYGHEGAPDGEKRALHRIHVTGGTNGIRFDALRRHRPFTPSFVGRAEDQAYILSVLSGGGGSALRYAHASGLIMRHDKEAFAAGAVKAGKAGSYVGDLVRIFVYSAYAGFLPGGARETKKIVDPFTGCFITDMPATIALLRLALRLLAVEGGSTDERRDLLRLAGRRLTPWILDRDGQAKSLKEKWIDEKRAWDAYYRALDSLEDDLRTGAPGAKRAAEEFVLLLEECRIAG